MASIQTNSSVMRKYTPSPTNGVNLVPRSTVPVAPAGAYPVWLDIQRHLHVATRDIMNYDPRTIWAAADCLTGVGRATLAAGATGDIASPVNNLADAKTLSVAPTSTSPYVWRCSGSFPSAITLPPQIAIVGPASLGVVTLAGAAWAVAPVGTYNEIAFDQIDFTGQLDFQDLPMDTPLLTLAGGSLAGLQTNGKCLSYVECRDVKITDNIAIVNTNATFVDCEYLPAVNMSISHTTAADMIVAIDGTGGGNILSISATSGNALTVVLTGYQDWTVNVNVVTNVGGLVLVIDDVMAINWAGGTQANTNVLYAKDATQVGYTPAVSGNWSPIPAIVSDALDQLAADIAGPGTGDVNGPGSSTDNAIARFDGTGGKTIQNSSVTISDAGNVDTAGVIQADTLAPHSAGALTVQAPSGSVLLIPNASSAVEVTAGQGVYTTDVKGPAGALTALVNGLNPLSCVVGPASSTDNALVRFDAGTGKLVQNSTWLLGDTGTMSIGSTSAIRFNTTTGCIVGLNAGGGVAAPGARLTCVGSSAGAVMQDTGGFYSTLIGALAGYQMTTGIRNTLIGTDAGYSLTTGSYNTIVGSDPAILLTGDRNTIMGYGVLSAKTTAVNCTAIGHQAGYLSPATVNGCIYLGSYGNAADVDNTMRLGVFSGTYATAATFIAGVRGVTTAGSAIPVLVDSNGQFGTTSSSIQYKENVVTISDEECARIHDMRFVDFNYIGSSFPQRGVIAEEIAPIDDSICIYDDAARTQMRTVDYQQIMVLVGAEVQRMKRQMDAQAGLISDLTARIVALEA